MAAFLILKERTKAQIIPPIFDYMYCVKLTQIYNLYAYVNQQVIKTFLYIAYQIQLELCKRVELKYKPPIAIQFQALGPTLNFSNPQPY